MIRTGKVTDQTRRKWIKRVAFCLKYQDILSDWELGFLESIINRLSDEKVDLSLKQSFKLGEIFKRVEGIIG